MTGPTGDDAPVERKRWRVTFEVEATARELSDEVVRETASHFSNSDEILASPQHAEAVESQRRLLAAIRANRQVFGQWMWLQALVPFEGDEAYNRLNEAAGVVSDRDADLIFRVVEELPAEDRRFFEEMEKAEVLAENTEELSDCFNSRIVSVQVEEIDEF